jgi:cytochrome c oxidase subunit 3
MTFVLISSSGTMAMAVNYGYRRDRAKTAVLMLVTAAFGATFVGMQAFEWSKLIHEGVRPGRTLGRGPVRLLLLHDHGLPRHPRDDRRDLPAHHRAQGLAGDFDQERRGFFTSRKGRYEIVEIMGLYWHFVDLVWVFIFALFYLW